MKSRKLKKFKKYQWPIIAITLLFVSSVTGFVLYNEFPLSDLVSLSFYQALANPSVRIVRIPEGLRKEQVADTLAEDLGWSDTTKNEFLNAHIAFNQGNLEGYYFPTTYLINKHDSPVAITQTMVSTFETQAQTIKKTKTTKIINQDTALKVASIIQREAAGKGDMRLISGIIWNRIFMGMKLQMDATLQYAKGDEGDWWPQVTPVDKTINSPYNTYLHTDLPPTPISNPGLAAISAAYNPQTTSCIFYIHDKKGNIHCSTTYQGQLNNIAKYY